MGRLQAISISILVGAVAAGGAAAAFKTVHLGQAAAAPAGPARVPSSVIAARRAKLATWSTALERARTAKPPALPTLPALPHVAIPAMPVLQAPVTSAAAGQQVRHVIEHRVIALPPKHAVQPAPATPEEQVTYVQAPPIVQYQQAAPAPAAAGTTATASAHHEDDSEEHGDHGGQSGSDGTSGAGGGSTGQGGDD
jgi:uncharacterized membrane protein YgcG